METFEREGAVIGFNSEGSGPAILFLHNGGTSSTIWRHQVAELSGRYRAIVVDLPGFGCATRAPGGIELAGHVELLSSLLEALGVSTVLAVGNCMGANIAASLATADPHVVSGLVLVNPLTERTFSAGWLGVLHRLPGPGPVTLRWFANRLVPPRIAAVATARFQLGREGIRSGLHRDAALLDAIQGRDALPALMDVLGDMKAYGHLDGQSLPEHVPVCTVWGAQNKVLSPKAGLLLNATLSPERAELLQGCGHLPMLEDPETVTKIIDEFARDHLLAPVPTGDDLP